MDTIEIPVFSLAWHDVTMLTLELLYEKGYSGYVDGDREELWICLYCEKKR